jgi:hypothetical protein
VPAATPLPRGPSVLTLYSAADLLIAPGCPVCRYAGEASDRYLGWFALEGHSDPGFTATLRGSLGMCDRHTRYLLTQPGAAIRLTAVYRYVVPAARDQLTGRAGPVRPCPACAHDRAAADRALETLADGIAAGEALDRCRELGGVCMPHLRSVTSSGPRRVAAFLGDTLHEAMSPRPAPPGWLAGSDSDAEVRAGLRRALPATGTALAGACTACLAAACAERDCLARVAAQVRGDVRAAEPELPVCARHLADLAETAATAEELWSVLAAQAGAQISRAQPRGRRGGGPAGWPWSRRIHDGPADCLVCRARSAAESGMLADVAAAARRPERWPGQLCVRHHLSLRDQDSAAARTLAASPVVVADQLARELAGAFEQTTWAARRGATAPESSAWRRAAAFLDGGVLGGCVPPVMP